MSITFLLFQFVNILDSEEAQFYVKNIVIYMGKMAVAAFQAKFQALIWKASSQLPLNSVLQVQSWEIAIGLVFFRTNQSVVMGIPRMML